MTTQTISLTTECAELEVSVRGVVELMWSSLSLLAVAVSHEDPLSPELQVLEDAMKVLNMVVENLASTYVGEPVRSLDELDSKYRQQDYKLQQRIKAQYLTRQVKDTVVMQLQDEIKELRRRLATFEEGDHTLIALEKEAREKLAAKVQGTEEEIVAHKEFSTLVHRDLACKASEFRHFISQLEHALSTLEDNFNNMKKHTKDWAIHTTYEIFLKECQRFFDEAIASMGCASMAVILRSSAMQKSIRDGMNFTAMSLLLNLHDRTTGSDEPETEVVEVEARIGNLERKILLHHDEVKLQADNLRLSSIDARKLNDLLNENLEVCQKHIKALQEMIDDREKRGIQGEVSSEDSACPR